MWVDRNCNINTSPIYPIFFEAGKDGASLPKHPSQGAEKLSALLKQQATCPEIHHYQG
jgi:hypothetical protein